MELQLFTYQDHQVRTVVVDGEPRFVLADLCRVLGLGNVTMTARKVDPDALNQIEVTDSLGRKQNATIVNESGMYEVVIRSDKPEAVKFRRWITSEVLPTIRKTGSYGKLEAQIPKTLPEALRAYAREFEAREAIESYARELEPAADAYKAFMDGDGTYSVGAVAKMLTMSQNKLFDQLRNTGIMIAKGAMRNTPYQHYMHHFAVKAYEFERHDGTRGTSYTTRVQPSGVEFIRRKLGLLPMETAAAS